MLKQRPKKSIQWLLSTIRAIHFLHRRTRMIGQSTTRGLPNAGRPLGCPSRVDLTSWKRAFSPIGSFVLITVNNFLPLHLREMNARQILLNRWKWRRWRDCCIEGGRRDTPSRSFRLGWHGFHRFHHLVCIRFWCTIGQTQHRIPVWRFPSTVSLWTKTIRAWRSFAKCRHVRSSVSWPVSPTIFAPCVTLKFKSCTPHEL